VKRVVSSFFLSSERTWSVASDPYFKTGDLKSESISLPFPRSLLLFSYQDHVVAGMLVDVVLLHVVSLEKRPVFNFKSAPLSFSQERN
jgi:hypothetical protein